jgi:hypothetical protein
MDELIRVSRAILEDFDLYGQPISLRFLAKLRKAVEAAEHSVQADGCKCCAANAKWFKYCPDCGRLLPAPATNANRWADSSKRS